VIGSLRGGPPVFPPVDGADPYGADLQLALYCLYELHYRGFAGVADELEWDPALLTVRAVGVGAVHVREGLRPAAQRPDHGGRQRAARLR
jgi:hypothetical protein